MVNMMKLN